MASDWFHLILAVSFLLQVGTHLMSATLRQLGFKIELVYLKYTSIVCMYDAQYYVA